MITPVPVTIERLIGKIEIESLDGTKRIAGPGEFVKAGEALIPKKNSSCVILGPGFPIADISNTDGRGKTNVRCFHPLARYSEKPTQKLTATALKIGDKLLIVQAQREAAKGVHTYSLIVKL